MECLYDWYLEELFMFWDVRDFKDIPISFFLCTLMSSLCLLILKITLDLPY